MATSEADFRASDLIGSAGIGSNAEKLIDTLTYHVPPELDAAMTRRINERLTAQSFPMGDSRDDQDTAKKSRASVAKFAGVKDDENLTMEAVVRGGERNPADAWVTYVYLDERGTDVKGAFPYKDLGKSSSDSHISQRSSVMKSPAARDHLAAQAKADAGGNSGYGDGDAPAPADPFAALADASAGDLINQMEEHPERADAIKAFEKATRGDKARKTVMEYEPEPESESGDGGDSGVAAGGGTQT